MDLNKEFIQASPVKMIFNVIFGQIKFKFPFEVDKKTFSDLKNALYNRIGKMGINIDISLYKITDEKDIQYLEDDLILDILIPQETTIYLVLKNSNISYPINTINPINPESNKISKNFDSNPIPINSNIGLTSNLGNPVVNTNNNLIQNITKISNNPNPIPNANFNQNINKNANLQPINSLQEEYKKKYKKENLKENLIKNPMFFYDKYIEKNIPEKNYLNEIDINVKLLLINYKILQIDNFSKSYQIKVPENMMLSNLEKYILNNHNLSEEKYSLVYFDSEGLPLHGSLIQSFTLQIKEIIPINEEIYCIICNKNIEQQSYEKIDHTQGPHQVFIQKEKELLPIKCDLAKDTVLQIKQKIFSLIELPTALFNLSFVGKALNDANKIVDYNVQENQTITMKDQQNYFNENSGYNSNFFNPALTHTIFQSVEGCREFRTHLMALNLEENKKKQFIALLQDISYNNPPLIQSLLCLFENKTLRLTHKIAIEESFLLIFSQLFLNSIVITKDLDTNPERIFENSRICFGYLLSIINDAEFKPFIWQDKLVSNIFDNTCNLTFTAMKNPVYLLYDNGTKRTADKEAVLRFIKENKKVFNIENLTEDKIFEDNNLKKQCMITSNLKYSSLTFWKVQTSFYKCTCRIYALPDNEKELTDLINETQNGILKIYDPIQIKNKIPVRSISYNRNNLIIYVGTNKDPKFPVNIFDIQTGNEKSIDPNELAIVITREPVEAIAVLVDVSGSMASPFINDRTISRIGAIKAFFCSFADRTLAYDLPHVIALICFDSQVTLKCDFTENFSSFKYHVNNLTPSGMTKLYDSFTLAVDKLRSLQITYPNIIKRIICLSDGDDTASYNNAKEVANRMQQENIIVDSFIVGDTCEGLKGITFGSGGNCFCPNSMSEAIQLFECETVLRACIREKKPLKLINKEKIFKKYKRKNFNDKPDEMSLPSQINNTFSNLTSTLKNLYDNPNKIEKILPSSRMKRIVKEMNNYQNNPHPFIQIFPSEIEIDFWKILLKGPESTPYDGGMFILYTKFPEDYPLKPPDMRFFTPIYHCNINSNGRICHSIFDRNYTVDTTIRHIIDCVYGLILTPEPDDPLDSAKATEFLINKPKYEAEARKMCQEKACKPLEQVLCENSLVSEEDNLDIDLQKKMQEIEEFFSKK